MTTPAHYYAAADQALSRLAAEAEVPLELLAPTPPAVPCWVENRAKWVTLSRAERRQLERHHRKQTKRRG